MANLLDVNITRCGCEPDCKIQTVTIDDVNSELFVGGVFSLSGITGNKLSIPYGCYNITRLQISVRPASAVIVSPYLDCEECITDISNAVRFTSCDPNSQINTVYFDKTLFTPLPTVGDVFFLEFYIIGKDSSVELIKSCFTYQGPIVIGENILNNYSLVSSTPYIDCETCKLDSPIIYQVSECFGGTYYIAFPSNTFQNHLVTFTGLDGVTQYCGTVKEESSNSVTGLLVSDLGLFDKNNNCDTCLTTVAEKKKLVNCLNPSDFIIVWASQLFETGDVTNISINNSCYIISPDPVDPSTPVTYSELADFDPHAGCENCFECHGLTFDFSSCTEVNTCGIIPLYTDSIGNKGHDIIIDDTYAYLGFQNGYVTKYDLTTNTSVSSYFLGTGTNNSYQMGFDDINKILSVPVDVSNSILFIDTITGSVYTETLPSFNLNPTVCYYNSSDSLTYVGVGNSSGSNPLIRIYSVPTYNTPSLTAQISYGGIRPTDILIVGNVIFISDINNCVYMYDKTSYTLLSTQCFGQTTSLVYNPFSNIIYATGNYSQIYTINPLTFQINNFSPPFPSCCGEKTVMYNTSDNRIYVSDSNSAEIYSLDSSTYTILETYIMTSDSQPYNMAMYGGSVYVISDKQLSYIGCSNEFIQNSIDSYEYMNIGDSFYHPVYGVCCTVTGIRTDLDGEYSFLSLKSYSGGCSQCESVTHKTFTVESCEDNIPGIMVAIDGEYSVGDFVRSHWGNSEYLCFEVTGEYTSGTPVNGVIFETEGHSPYASCLSCSTGAAVGLTIINCDTLVESYVNVSLETYSNIVGLNSFPTQCISDVNGNCYTVVNSCPIDNVYEPLLVSNYYTDCVLCSLNNQRNEPRSANTETNLCLEICTESGTTVVSVTPPHPEWTDGYGTQVTQLDMITLGGINGLNN